MGTVVNLNRYRKEKQRAARERRANEKRMLFGLPKIEHTKNAPQRSLDKRRLHAMRRDDRTSEGEDSAGPPRTGVPFASAPHAGRNGAMSRPRKRSFTIDGHPTSLSLEQPFWDALQDIAAVEKRPVSRLISDIDASRG